MTELNVIWSSCSKWLAQTGTLHQSSTIYMYVCWAKGLLVQIDGTTIVVLYYVHGAEIASMLFIIIILVL